nr:NADH dehydrogenase subunit 6 [Aeschrocoris tuberculatus]
MMLSIMMSLSLTLIWLKHPLSMGFALIMQTLIVATIIGIMMESFFFSYIIIIIMLSGALVLFIYMASVASNEKFQTNMYVMIWSIGSVLLLLSIMSFTSPTLQLKMNMSEKISLIKMFNSLTAHITVMMILYLLLTMIVISNIASVTEGPLRMKKYE